MNEIKRYMHLYPIYIKQFFKSIMQSKLDFFLGMIGFFFTQFAGIAFLYLVFQQIPALAGWSLDELIFIYGFAQIPRGIDHLFTDNIWLLAWRLVVNGGFDRYLLRPMGLFFQIIFEKLQPDALGELVVGISLVVISLRKNLLIITPLNVLLFIISVLAGALIYTAIKLFFATLSFWVQISGPFLQVAYESADFAKYPTEIYNKLVRGIITFIIPFAFVAYLPAKYFLGKASALSTIGIEVIIAILFMGIATAFFHKGTTIYESCGN